MRAAMGFAPLSLFSFFPGGRRKGNLNLTRSSPTLSAYTEKRRRRNLFLSAGQRRRRRRRKKKKKKKKYTCGWLWGRLGGSLRREGNPNCLRSVWECKHVCMYVLFA
jgi:hypothetical protein